MKKKQFLSGALVAAALATGVPVGATVAGGTKSLEIVAVDPAPGTNMLTNGGFEDTEFNAWTIFNLSRSAMLSLTDQARSGSQAARFMTTDAGASFVQFDNTLADSTEGAIYSMGIWARLSEEQPTDSELPLLPELPGAFQIAGPTETAAFTLVVWADGDEVAQAAFAEEALEVTDQWKFYSLSFTLPADGYTRAYPEIYLESAFTNVEFDDAVFIEGEFTTPTMPTDLAVAVDPTSAVVSWEASTVSWDSGDAVGSAPTYTVTAEGPMLEEGAAARLVEDAPDLPSCTTTELSCEIDGLVPSAEYAFIVTPSNAAGDGESATELATTPADEGDGGETVDELAPLRQVQAERESAGKALETAHGIVARLYWAVLGRAPETGGARFWFDAYDSGDWGLRRIATHFSVSEEFVARFGSDLSNEAFAQLVYTNALGRTPDAGGLAFWIGQLDAGMARSEMVLLISDSPEFRSSHPLPWES